MDGWMERKGKDPRERNAREKDDAGRDVKPKKKRRKRKRPIQGVEILHWQSTVIGVIWCTEYSVWEEYEIALMFLHSVYSRI